MLASRRLVMVSFVSLAACGKLTSGDVGDTPVADSNTPPQPPETRVVVDPSLPAGIADQFDALTLDPGLSVVYPNPKAVIPKDVAALDIQAVAVAGLEVYRFRFAVDDGNELRGYVPAATWIPDDANWRWLTERAAGHTITLTVAGGHLDGGNVVGPGKISEPQPLIVSRDAATGAMFYFATTGDQITGTGVLHRLTLGAREPDVYLNNDTGGSKCVGCHAISRDGKRISFVGMGTIGSDRKSSLVNAEDPTTRTALAGASVAIGAFSPDGSKFVASSGGALALYDAATGTKLSAITTSGPALYPDWSWDGNTLAFVRPSSMCTPGVVDFGQKDVFVYGGSIVTMKWNGTTFVDEQVVVAADSSFNNFYPSFSPDGTYLAFARASMNVASSWGLAATACIGKGSTGVSYDNPSASVWVIPMAGGSPTRLDTANSGMNLTNSWPKWAPKADGEYLWISLSSKRPYGLRMPQADAHHQVWFTAVKRPGASSGDPSAPAVWFPFQQLSTKNHVGQWSLKVGDFVIE